MCLKNLSTTGNESCYFTVWNLHFYLGWILSGQQSCASVNPWLLAEYFPICLLIYLTAARLFEEDNQALWMSLIRADRTWRLAMSSSLIYRSSSISIEKCHTSYEGQVDWCHWTLYPAGFSVILLVSDANLHTKMVPGQFWLQLGQAYERRGQTTVVNGVACAPKDR